MLVAMPRRKPRVHPALRAIDRDALEAFQAGIRKQYSDEEMLEQLRACARRLGRSPTMREFAADTESTIHPQTVIARFGSWNRAKRQAGLTPRRFATREELLEQLRHLGEDLGHVPTARDLDEHRGRMPSKSLYWHTFGSLATALREAGFDVPVGEERVDRALDQGVELAQRLGRLPKFADWGQARKSDAWATFQFLIRERLLQAGVDVTPDGRLA
jgi:HNH endonuclease